MQKISVVVRWSFSQGELIEAIPQMMGILEFSTSQIYSVLLGRNDIPLSQVAVEDGHCSLNKISKNSGDITLSG